MDWNWKDWLLMIFVIVVLSVFFNFMGMYLTSDVVEVNLVNANSDFAGGKNAWQFKIDGRDVPAGESVRVYSENFKIKVIEFKSQDIVDEMNIGSLIEEDDLITYAYYGPTSTQGESLYIYIQHKDGDTREVKVNIDNNQ